MNWTYQGILLLILVLLFMVRDAVAPRAARLCRNLAIGIMGGGLLSFAGAQGLLAYIESRGPGVFNWVPQPIVFGRSLNLLVITLDYAPLAGALAGAVCAWWVIYLRRPRDPEDS